jgi:hypothetical protein
MTRHTEPSRHLVEEIVRTGLLITGVLEDLLECLPEDAFPGESEGEVLLSMLHGTVHPAAVAAGEETVAELIALLGAVSDRVMTDLEIVADMVRAREG